MYRPPSNAAAMQPGQPQGQPKFKVIKVLGKGSYGTVYKVQRLADGQEYAMKETDMSRMGHQERSDAVNEIRLLGSLNHPNVVRHHETFLAGNKLCIVMEFAPAGDLAGFVKAAVAARAPLPEATVWQIFLQLCQGMQAIHETCVIHRDIKPANIFMCPGNIVKVGDLGVAKALNKAHYAQTQIGTPVFMAPEVWRGLPYGYSSDLWSLGCVLYEMMTYRLPFDGRSLGELKNRIIAGRFQLLQPGSYSHELISICHALLSQDARKRPTCAALLNCPEAAKWMHTIPEEARVAPPPVLMPVAGAPNGALLPTIRVPRDIRLLPSKLPKANYGSDDAADSTACDAPGAAAQPAPQFPNGYGVPQSRYGPSPSGYGGLNGAFAAPQAALAPVRERGERVAGRARVPTPTGAAAAAAAPPAGGGARMPSPRDGGAAARAAAAAAAAAGQRPRSGQAAAGGAGSRAAPPGVLQQFAAQARQPPSTAAARGAVVPQAAAGMPGKPRSRPPSGGGGIAAGVVPGSHRPVGGHGYGIKAGMPAASPRGGLGMGAPRADMPPPLQRVPPRARAY